MSGEDLFVTVPKAQLEELRAQIALARGEAAAATTAAARANADLAGLRDLLAGLREAIDRRVEGALLDAGAGPEPEPVADGFQAYRRRVLAAERGGA